MEISYSLLSIYTVVCLFMAILSLLTCGFVILHLRTSTILLALHNDEEYPCDEPLLVKASDGSTEALTEDTINILDYNLKSGRSIFALFLKFIILMMLIF